MTLSPTSGSSDERTDVRTESVLATPHLWDEAGIDRSLQEALHELLRREKETLRSREQIQLITDALPFLVAYVDAERRYAFVNATYEHWLGQPRSELMGRTLEACLGEQAFAIIRPHVERALAGHPVMYETELSYPDGRVRSIEATYIPQFADDGAVLGFVSLVADITERTSFERYRAAAASRNARLLSITTAIANAVGTQEVFEAVVDQVAATMNASSAGLWLLQGEGKTARLQRALGYEEPVRAALETLPLEEAPAMPVLDCMRLGRPVWLPSQDELFASYPHLRGTATAGRTYRIACLPLIAQGQTLGALGLTIEGRGEQTEDEKSFLVLVARYASQALQRSRILEDERESRARADAAAHRMRLISQASRAFGEAQLDFPERLHDVLAELGAALGSCVFMWLVEEDGWLHLAGVHHPEREAEILFRELASRVPLHPGEGVLADVFTKGVSVLLPSVGPEDLAARAVPAYRDALRRFPLHALMAAPLRVRGEVIGFVTAARAGAGETYSEEDLTLFEELAARGASALDTSRLYQGNVEARKRAEQLYRFAQVVTSADRIEQVLEAAMDVIESTLGARRTAVLTYGDEATMRFRAWRHLSDTYRAAVEGHSPWPRDATAPEAVLIGDVDSDERAERFRPALRAEGIRAVGFIPLVTRGRLLGKFMIYYDGPHVWAPQQVETAGAIANHLASVIDRFRATTKLEDTIRQNELFAAVLAHDLRNPLNAIMMAAQAMLMLGEGEVAREDARMKPLSRIVTSGRRMKRMIELLLDFTRARSGGGIQIERRPANMLELCEQAISELELANPAWRIRCELHGDPSGCWDPDRMLQVISNLVANAGQHGRSGSEIAVQIDGTQAPFVSVTVHNDGVIPESVLPHLFDPFLGSTRRRGAAGGLGLGLFIVNELVIAHGGSVVVASSEQAGTAFTARLERGLVG